MAKAKDLRFDDVNDDLFIDAETGDFAATDSDTRHVNDIIEAFTGWWKESPTVGVGIRKSSAASGGIQRVSREIKIQMVGDGYNVTGIEFETEGKVFVTGNRKDVNL